MVTDLFAGVRVRNVAAARSRYERLLGSEPSFFPNNAEAVWDLDERRWLYIPRGPGGRRPRARHHHGRRSRRHGRRDRPRGIDPVNHEDYGAARKTVYNDPDGNEIGIGQVPAET